MVNASESPFLGEHDRLGHVADPIDGQGDSASQRDLARFFALKKEAPLLSRDDLD